MFATLSQPTPLIDAEGQPLEVEMQYALYHTDTGLWRMEGQGLTPHAEKATRYSGRALGEAAASWVKGFEAVADAQTGPGMLTEAGVAPDYYRKQVGRCPAGYAWDDDKGHCVPTGSIEKHKKVRHAEFIAKRGQGRGPAPSRRHEEPAPRDKAGIVNKGSAKTAGEDDDEGGEVGGDGDMSRLSPAARNVSKAVGDPVDSVPSLMGGKPTNSLKQHVSTFLSGETREMTAMCHTLERLSGGVLTTPEEVQACVRNAASLVKSAIFAALAGEEAEDQEEEQLAMAVAELINQHPANPSWLIDRPIQQAAQRVFDARYGAMANTATDAHSTIEPDDSLSTEVDGRDEAHEFVHAIIDDLVTNPPAAWTGTTESLASATEGRVDYDKRVADALAARQAAEATRDAYIRDNPEPGRGTPFLKQRRAEHWATHGKNIMGHHMAVHQAIAAHDKAVSQRIRQQMRQEDSAHPMRRLKRYKTSRRAEEGVFSVESFEDDDREASDLQSRAMAATQLATRTRNPNHHLRAHLLHAAAARASRRMADAPGRSDMGLPYHKRAVGHLQHSKQHGDYARRVWTGETAGFTGLGLAPYQRARELGHMLIRNGLVEGAWFDPLDATVKVKAKTEEMDRAVQVIQKAGMTVQWVQGPQPGWKPLGEDATCAALDEQDIIEFADEPDFTIEDVQFYFDMRIMSGEDVRTALERTRKKFSIDSLQVSPMGDITSPNIALPSFQAMMADQQAQAGEEDQEGEEDSEQ